MAGLPEGLGASSRNFLNSPGGGQPQRAKPLTKADRCPLCKGKGTVKPPKRFGIRCLYEREKRGLSLRQAADEIGVAASTIMRIEKEHGQPRLGHGLRLAVFYRLNLADFPELLESKP